jgi:hypothetical protein
MVWKSCRTVVGVCTTETTDHHVQREAVQNEQKEARAREAGCRGEGGLRVCSILLRGRGSSSPSALCNADTKLSTSLQRLRKCNSSSDPNRSACAIKASNWGRSVHFKTHTVDEDAVLFPEWRIVMVASSCVES